MAAFLWVITAVGAIGYFNWYRTFVPGLLIHSGIILVCMACTIGLNKPLKIKGLLYVLSLKQAQFRYYLIAFVFAIVLWLADFWLQLFFFLDDGLSDGLELQKEFKQLGSISIILAVCFLAPVAEEILFRGILLKGLNDKLKPVWAIAISSILFAAIHFSAHDFLTLFIAGSGYSLLTLKAQSILPAILAHVMNNSMTLYYLATLHA